MRSEKDINRVINKYGDMVRRICFIRLKNHSDVEDVFQSVFLKYVLYDGFFESEEHEKAWIIRVTLNLCKDFLKSFFKRYVYSFEDLLDEPIYIEKNSKEILDVVLKLPNKYKDVIYLSYYEGYSATEIATILNKKENTIYTWLSRAKKMLKKELGGDYLE